MTKILTGVGLLAVIPVARAHDSWAPHTHTVDNRFPDLLYLCAAGVATSILAGFVLRALAKRRVAKSARSQKRVR